ncbi:MAG TPA: pyridoxal-phosphate dependent enzyme [Candidatus Cloacimonadota bacterium]|nr:pyridoxal-phosphate dependent enzyme [Candidatus Cloacimonadota bacterium]
MNYKLKSINNGSFLLDESIIHGLVGGNKYRKVKAIIGQAKNLKGITSFGSPFSSHIVACSYWAKYYGIPFDGIVITDRTIDFNEFPNLRLALRLGAHLTITSHSDAYQSIQALKDKQSDYKWIPGGAHTVEAAKAYEELFLQISRETDVLLKVTAIILPFGTGTTAYGIWNAIRKLDLNTEVIGISVSRDIRRCYSALSELEGITEFPGLNIIDSFAGTYGQRNPDTEEARQRFFSDTGVLPDPIYNSLSACYYYKQKHKKALIINTGGTLNNLI